VTEQQESERIDLLKVLLMEIFLGRQEIFYDDELGEW
jgi:hypothetical protein